MLERDRYYTTEEVASFLGVHVETVRRKIRQGQLPAQRQFIGKGYKILGSDVLDRVGEIQAEETGNG